MCGFINKIDIGGIQFDEKDIQEKQAIRKKEFYLTLSIIFRKQKEGLKIIGKAQEIKGIISQNLSNEDIENIYFYPEPNLHISLVSFITHKHEFNENFPEVSINEFKQNLMTDPEIISFQQNIFDYFKDIYLCKRYLGTPNLRAYYDFLYCDASVALQVFIPPDLARICSNLVNNYIDKFPCIEKKLHPKIDIPRRAAMNIARFNKIPSNIANLKRAIINYNEESNTRFKTKESSFINIDQLSLVVSDDILSNSSPEIMPVYLTK